jgi:hypothetical protein
MNRDFVRWSSCNISNPTMRTGLDFKSAQFDQGLDQNKRTWNLVLSELEDLKWHLIRINHYLKWGELILIQSKVWINFDPVLGLPGSIYFTRYIKYYHVSKIKQRGWLHELLMIWDWYSIKCSLQRSHLFFVNKNYYWIAFFIEWKLLFSAVFLLFQLPPFLNIERGSYKCNIWKCYFIYTCAVWFSKHILPIMYMLLYWSVNRDIFHMTKMIIFIDGKLCVLRPMS